MHYLTTIVYPIRSIPSDAIRNRLMIPVSEYRKEISP